MGSITGLCPACVPSDIGPPKAPAFCRLQFWGEKQSLLGPWRMPSSGSLNLACTASTLSQLVLTIRDTKTRNYLSRTTNVKHQCSFNKSQSPTETKHPVVLHRELQQGPTVLHAPAKPSPSEELAISPLISG